MTPGRSGATERFSAGSNSLPATTSALIARNSVFKPHPALVEALSKRKSKQI